MTTNSRRTSQLGQAPTLQETDRVVVLTNPNTAIANTQTIAVSKFINALGDNIPGPFANDSVANTNGIALTNIYFDTNGILRIRIL